MGLLYLLMVNYALNVETIGHLFDRRPEHFAADASFLCGKVTLLGATIKGTSSITKTIFL
jgi:hypothetical protein